MFFAVFHLLVIAIQIFQFKLNFKIHLRLFVSFRFVGYSCLMVCGASASPLTLSLSAVFRKAGSWSWATLTSPAYMNSRMAVKCCNKKKVLSFSYYQKVNWLKKAISSSIELIIILRNYFQPFDSGSNTVVNISELISIQFKLD